MHRTSPANGNPGGAVSSHAVGESSRRKLDFAGLQPAPRSRCFSTAAGLNVSPPPVPLSRPLLVFVSLVMSLSFVSSAAAESSLTKAASWQAYDVKSMTEMLLSAVDQIGLTEEEIDEAAEAFLTSLDNGDQDPLDAYVRAAGGHVPIIDQLMRLCQQSAVEAGQSLDPNTTTYAQVETLPQTMRSTLRTWLGRELVRLRLFDEALPVIAEVDPVNSIDPAAALFYRGACYHALLMKSEALADLRRLLENEDDAPLRFSRTAQMMIADIKPLKKDSLDEISRLMTDVTRRLDLGRPDDQTKQQEQKIIDKLTKLIDKLEQQQQQQQQQQQSSGSKSQGSSGQGSPMDDSRIAGGSGKGDVDRKKIDDRDGWGNLPPAERQQALQQIGRDLPTHYREAIEAYFRKMATEG